MIEKSNVISNGRKLRIIFICESSAVYRHKCPQGHKPKWLGTKKCKCPSKLKG